MAVAASVTMAASEASSGMGRRAGMSSLGAQSTTDPVRMQHAEIPIESQSKLPLRRWTSTDVF